MSGRVRRFGGSYTLLSSSAELGAAYTTPNDQLRPRELPPIHLQSASSKVAVREGFCLEHADFEALARLRLRLA